jgi:malate dehydrogenase (oxaloacetate-decarboxylating)(NADP+)
MNTMTVKTDDTQTATTLSHSEAEDGVKGIALLNGDIRNHDTAFSPAERRAYGIEGLLPHAYETLERQTERVLRHLEAKTSDLDRYIYLISLVDRNETLFFHTVMSDPARFIPILYDPTVADACEAFGHIYRRPRGMYITREMKGRIAEVLRNWPEHDVRFICVSTGGRILGLGDIGANGMGIPIGKLQLYTACAAVPPQYMLPVLFDIGTTNAMLRADPLYLGIRDVPPPQEELDELVDEFVKAVQELFPECCIHFEDWKGTDAVRYLSKYKDKILCYNDDIQGTASVALAGVIAALKITQAPITTQRVLFLGAGSAGTGIAGLIVSAMKMAGLSDAEAHSRIALFDTHGLVVEGRANLAPHKQPWIQKLPASKPFDVRDLASEQPEVVAAVETFKPTILIGVSTCGSLMSSEVIEAMSRLNERPIIFPLSNPTRKAECTAEQAYTWSKGKALYASGVQFPDVQYQGQTFHPGQGNNFYIYPAIGLATFVARPSRLTEQCFILAAQATADQVDSDMRASGRLYPTQSNILETEVTTATRVAEYMFDSGLAKAHRPKDIRAWIEGQLYVAKYETPNDK